MLPGFFARQRRLLDRAFKLSSRCCFRLDVQKLSRSFCRHVNRDRYDNRRDVPARYVMLVL